MHEAHRILIVDNFADNAESLALLLAGEGRAVDVVHTGRQAIGRATMWRPHVIVLDLGLPDVSGEDVVAALRAAGSTAYIIAYSGFHKREGAVRAVGCDAFVLKPQLESLLAIVEDISRKATA
jgi:two-component system CheB/CheR fusion protein